VPEVAEKAPMAAARLAHDELREQTDRELATLIQTNTRQP
jgi:hypothetical protein